MLYIRQNATHTVPVGPFVDVTDGFTPETGITLSGADEAEALQHDTGTVVDISGYTWAAITSMDGWYNLTLQTGITDTVGHLTIAVHDDSECLPVFMQFMVVEEAVYDAMFAASAPGPLEADDTGAGFTAVPWNSAWDAEVQSEVDDALVANHLDHLLAVDYDPSSPPGVSTALLNEIVENDGGVSRFTVNALENAPSGSGASAATIADAVWDEARADHVASGSFGEALRGVVVDTAQGGSASTIQLASGAISSDDELNGATVRIIAGTGAGQSGRTVDGSTASNDTCNISPDWDTAPDATSVYEILHTAPTSTGDPPTVDLSSSALAAIQAEMEEDGASLLDTLRDRLTASRAAALDEVTSARMSELDAANIPSDLDDVLADTNELQTDDVPGLIAALNDLSAADVNAEVDTALSDYAPAQAGDAMDLVAGAVDSTSIADNAITAAKIATDAITAAKVAADAIGASELATDAVNEIVAAFFARTYDATDMDSVTFEEITALMGCALLGIASGMDTTSATFRNLADGANAISATVDADGNRSAVTLNLGNVR